MAPSLLYISYWGHILYRYNYLTTQIFTSSWWLTYLSILWDVPEWQLYVDPEAGIFGMVSFIFRIFYTRRVLVMTLRGLIYECTNCAVWLALVLKILVHKTRSSYLSVFTYVYEYDMNFNDDKIHALSDLSEKLLRKHVIITNKHYTHTHLF